MQTAQKNSVFGCQGVGYGVLERAVCIRNISDYSPFGVSLDGRTIQNDFYRHGFNGMEKDDELKGLGNRYDFGARMYDARVGRWWSVDPLASKYSFASPYIQALNNPLIFKDFDGRDIIIAFQGGFNSSGGEKLKCEDAGTTGKIVKEVLEQGWRENRNDIKSLVFSNSFSVDPTLAFNEFKAIYDKGEKIVIYGYSYGGDAAVEFAEKLKIEGYDVNLVVTVDGADGPLKGTTVDRSIPDNVELNLNFYQTAHSSLGSRGDKNIAEDPNETIILNRKITDVNVNHGNIDEITANRVVWYIENTFGLNRSSINNSFNPGSSSNSSGSSSNSFSNVSSSGSSYDDSSCGSKGSSGSSQGSSDQ